MGGAADFLALPGCSSLTQEQRTRLLKRLRILAPALDKVQSIEATYIHFINPTTEASLKDLSSTSSDSRKILESLLGYGQFPPEPLFHEATQKPSSDALYLFVIPRPASISPWSSKATDIMHLCRLKESVTRVERGVLYCLRTGAGASPVTLDDLTAPARDLLHDRMTTVLGTKAPLFRDLFPEDDPSQRKPLEWVDLLSEGASLESAVEKLEAANKTRGLALAPDEVLYLAKAFTSDELKRNPTTPELFSFAQVNSEHCRHKIFNADWTIDGQKMDNTLFGMIRNTHKTTPQGTISAYSDNAAVLEGGDGYRFAISQEGDSVVYAPSSSKEPHPILVKVETHNHPTAVSPYPGAATGAGGEIRDEGAVGRGSRPKAGLVGFMTSNVIPLLEEGEQIDESLPAYYNPGKPNHIASAKDIMLEGPLGSANFNNEFGRPGLTGFWRTWCLEVEGAKGTEIRGYHKPIMLAGGLGTVRPDYALKRAIPVGAKIIVLGGPGMLIGLGGGAASSMASGSSDRADLDFASVQRENPEMQRRCQMVIDACVSDTKSNPIQSIHDVGAGGLSNALPELVHDAGLGGKFELRDILVDDERMSPLEIWCNESQERYVLAVLPEDVQRFTSIAQRERCPFSVVGVATEDQRLVVTDRLAGNTPLDLPMSTLFGKPPKIARQSERASPLRQSFDASLKTYLPSAPTQLGGLVQTALDRVFRLPTVSSKSFLITIGDRSITSLVARDQMVGPWQVPVADVAVTRTAYGFDDALAGEAMCSGERTPLALLSPAASARMAVAESLTNLVAASVADITRVKLSANWMCAASYSDEGARLYEAVQSIGLDLCPKLGLAIPVGKDSMSMQMGWKDSASGQDKKVTAPMSVIITAFAPVDRIDRTWTPQLRTEDISLKEGEDTVLLFIDLAAGKKRLGGSVLSQVFGQLGSDCPDVDAGQEGVLKSFFEATHELKEMRVGRRAPGDDSFVLAYHDRSDGGLLTTVAEMAFAGRCGVEMDLDTLLTKGASTQEQMATLFAEELGAVMQVKRGDVDIISQVLSFKGIPASAVHVIGKVLPAKRSEDIRLVSGSETVYSASRASLQSIWAETSFRLQRERDDPTCARQEYERISQKSGQKGEGRLEFDLKYNPGDNFTGSFSLAPSPERPLLSRPKVAILREQGVNGHLEMAWAFHRAGFASVDVHMSDLISGRVSLRDPSLRGLVACGGFSFGDVLGAGAGWAKSALLNPRAREEFENFLVKRTDTFTLGICNGCQFLSHLARAGLVPGAEDWPMFEKNQSDRFEGRACTAEVADTEVIRKSVFLRDMAGSRLPAVVAHGEGRAVFASPRALEAVQSKGLVGLRYVESGSAPQSGGTEIYPANPNGSPDGITALSTPDGRCLAMMPHPERGITAESMSWKPPLEAAHWKGKGPWFRMFESARMWVG